MQFKYRAIVLDELARHGVKPLPSTPPEMIRDFINDLYVIEIRVLRDRVRAGLLAKQDLAASVRELRKQYMVLSIALEHWTE